MTLRTTLVLLCISLACCTSERTSNKTVSADSLRGKEAGKAISEPLEDTPKQLGKKNANTATLKEKLLGPWGNESSENAIFNIDADSIFYVDQVAFYKYSLTGDTITAYNTGSAYKSKISFRGDTLVMDSEGERTKFWRFRN